MVGKSAVKSVEKWYFFMIKGTFSKEMSTYRQHFMLLCIAMCSLFLSACAGQKATFSLQAFNQKEMIDVSLHAVETEKFTLHYAKTGNSDGPIVLFLHGTSGSWQSYTSLLKNKALQKKFTLIAIDRLGWGQSVSHDNSHQRYRKIDFGTHSEAIAAVIKQENLLRSSSKPVILVGHSLGASIAPRVAVDYPELIGGLLLVSGSIDPKLSKPRWYNRLAQFKLVNVFIPNHLIHSNREVISLPYELSEYDHKLSLFSFPITLVQGLKDGLVNPKNVQFAKKKFQHLGDDLELIEMSNAGHFVLWEDPETISDALLRLSIKHQNKSAKIE